MNGIDDTFFSIIFYPMKFFEKNVKKSNINKVVLWNNNSKKVLFILPQWMGRMVFYKILLNKLKKNYTIVFYRLPNRLLTDDPKEVIKYFKVAKKDVIETADTLVNQGYENFSIFGTSLSTIIALMVANSDNRFKKIILSLPGNDFAQCFWECKQLLVKTIRNKMQANNIGLIELKKYWKNLAPINNINNINKRKILVFLAKNDKVVFYKYGVELLRSMEKRKINFEFDINNVFGHYLSGLKPLLFPKKIAKFLED